MHIVKRSYGNPSPRQSELPREMTPDEMVREHERLRRDAWAASNRAGASASSSRELGEPKVDA